MKFVYVLQSISNPERHYTGVSDDAEKRLKEHNILQCIHTRKFAPEK